MLKALHQNGVTDATYQQLSSELQGTSIDYRILDALYKQSDLLKGIIKNYNKYGIEFDQGQGDAPATAKSDDTVKSMAKRATDLTDL